MLFFPFTELHDEISSIVFFNITIALSLCLIRLEQTRIITDRPNSHWAQDIKMGCMVTKFFFDCRQEYWNWNRHIGASDIVENDHLVSTTVLHLNCHYLYKKRAFRTRGTVEDSLPTDTLSFSTTEVSLSGFLFLQKRQQTNRHRCLSLSRALFTNAVVFTTFHADEITALSLSDIILEKVSGLDLLCWVLGTYSLADLKLLLQHPLKPNIGIVASQLMKKVEEYLHQQLSILNCNTWAASSCWGGWRTSPPWPTTSPSKTSANKSSLPPFSESRPESIRYLKQVLSQCLRLSDIWLSNQRYWRGNAH